LLKIWAEISLFKIKIKMKKLIITILILLISTNLFVPFSLAKDSYPKLGSYYLDPYAPKSDYENLAKYDLIIFDIDLPQARPDLIEYLRKENPDIKLFAYITSQSVADIDTLSDKEVIRSRNYNMALKNDWWLKDSSGNPITYSEIFWFIKCINPNDSWNDYLSDTIRNEVENSDVWDGVFLDVLVTDISWINNADIDTNQDGVKDTREEMNSYWVAQMDDLLKKVNQKISKPIIGNVNPIAIFEEQLNGALFEDFPTQWFGPKSWTLTMDQYLNKLPEKNQSPNFYVLNSTSNNTGNSAMYQEMRFGLASTLMGDGYHTFDFGYNEHSQAWWYDEYEVALGMPESSAYNLLDKKNPFIKEGLWRRDFENGIAIVNSTDKEQSYVFSQEEFEKINGQQDRSVNSGEKINFIKLAAHDGIILRKINNNIVNNSFDNGAFVRVFDKNGEKIRNGFYAYKDAYDGEAQVLISDIDNDKTDEVLINLKGKISIYKNGELLRSFMPYNGAFKGEVSFAVSDLNGDATQEIITGAGEGGGPHVRIFDIYGNPLTGGFFAYDENFRGGVDVVVMDLNGDASKEIVTSAGVGGGPHVRVFSKDGEPLTGGFFAYNDDFRGGVSVAAGDVDGDGEKEIITGAGAGNQPLVHVFSKDGNLLTEFLAYDADNIKGIKVMSDDIDKDGVDEIFVSLKE
jgi:hypothetical protein